MHKHAGKPEWTVLLHDRPGQKRRLDQITAYVQAGMSSAEIAEKFSGTTRDAVLGFCRRNGLKLSRGRGSGGATRSTRDARTCRSTTKLQTGPLPDMVVRAQGPGVPLLEIGPHMCRAPLWDNDTHACADFRFCGAIVGRRETYCPTHQAQFLVAQLRRESRHRS